MVKHTVVIPPFPKAPGGTVWYVYHFLSARGENVIKEWLKSERVSAAQRGNFQSKINSLERGGPDLVPGFIHGPVAKDIYKAKIKGNKGQVQLRPRLCLGPIGTFEFTFLVGAIEKGGRDIPDHCNTTAQSNRITVIADAGRRKREPIG